MFIAFDLLHQDGVDLRSLPLSERRRDLDRLCRKARVPFTCQVQTFPNGQLLFERCAKFGFEGVCPSASTRAIARARRRTTARWTIVFAA